MTRDCNAYKMCVLIMLSKRTFCTRVNPTFVQTTYSKGRPLQNNFYDDKESLGGREQERMSIFRAEIDEEAEDLGCYILSFAVLLILRAKNEAQLPRQ